MFEIIGTIILTWLFVKAVEKIPGNQGIIKW